MKKIFVIFMMMLVASVGYGQSVGNLFNKADEVGKREERTFQNMLDNIEKERWERYCGETVTEFVDRLRRDGEDVTKLDKEDIYRLDSLRVEKAKETGLSQRYGDTSYEKLLYTMPSSIFRSKMYLETRCYAKIVRVYDNKVTACKVDSIVFVDRGLYYINGSKKDIRMNYGDTVKVGRATFICKNNELEKPKKKKEKEYYIDEKSDDMYAIRSKDNGRSYGRVRTRDYAAEGAWRFSVYRLTGNPSWLIW